MLLLPPPRCERCETADPAQGVQMHPSRTCYVRRADKFERRAQRERRLAAEAAQLLGDPRWLPPDDTFLTVPDEVANRDRSLCSACAEEHHAYWDEMWAMVYANQG